MKKRILMTMIVSIITLYSGQSYSRTLESDLTYSLMDEYCTNIGRLAFRAATLKIASESDPDYVSEQLDNYISENINWNGKLAELIAAETIDMVNDLPIEDLRKKREVKIAKHNCNKRILFYKN